MNIKVEGKNSADGTVKVNFKQPFYMKSTKEMLREGMGIGRF